MSKTVMTTKKSPEYQAYNHPCGNLLAISLTSCGSVFKAKTWLAPNPYPYQQ